MRRFHVLKFFRNEKGMENDYLWNLKFSFLNVSKKEESIEDLKCYRDKMKSRVEISSLVGLSVGAKDR